MDTDLSAATGAAKLTCELCGIQATSSKNLQMHFNGKKHRRVMAAFRYYYNLYSADWDAVDESQSRSSSCDRRSRSPGREKNEEGCAPVDPKPKTKSAGPSAATRDKKLTCALCEIKATSTKNLQMHFNGNKHKKRALRKRSRTETHVAPANKKARKTNNPHDEQWLTNDFVYTSYSHYGTDKEHAFYERQKHRRKREQRRKAQGMASVQQGCWTRTEHGAKSSKFFRYKHVNKDLTLDWWSNSEKGTVYCSQNGYRQRHVRTAHALQEVLDRFA